MSLTLKRILAAIYLAILLLAAGNHYLAWNLAPGLDKKILAAVMFIGMLLIARFGPSMRAEIEEYRAKQKQQQEDNK